MTEEAMRWIPTAEVVDHYFSSDVRNNEDNRSVLLGVDNCFLPKN